MILASQSPRRRELLSLITPSFKVIPAKGEEILPEGISPKEAVILLSRQKAREIYREYKNETIIASDTVVAVDGKILGKPIDEADAARMLTLLSGRAHYVYTGVCVIREDGSEVDFAEETLVEFRDLSSREIVDYIATGEPMDKAGAYGIQDRGALLVRRIEGDYYNVMGLPVCRLYEVIRDTI